MNYDLINTYSSTVKQEEDAIWIKPVCDFFQISYKWQVEVVKKDPILSSMVRKNSNQKMFGDKRERVLLHKKGFLRWVQLLNPNTLTPELREKLIEFQTFIFDYMMGSFAALEQSRKSHAKLKELEQQKREIEKEIKKEKDVIDNYVHSLFVQTQLPLE